MSISPKINVCLRWIVASLLLALVSSAWAWFPAEAWSQEKGGEDKTHGVVNLNTATSDQLQLLPRVGPAMAGRIIKRREQRPFRRSSDLRRVRGIGPKTYRRLRPYVVTKGPTTLTHKVRASR